MKKDNVELIRISKVRSPYGHCTLCIQTGTQMPCAIEFKDFDTGKDLLSLKVEEAFRHIFALIKSNQGGEIKSINYKCVFSDKFLLTGGIVIKGKVEVLSKELVVPMNEEECFFITSCIPIHF